MGNNLRFSITDTNLLIYLLDKFGYVSGATRLQKLAFLTAWFLKEKGHRGFSFSFIRHNYGPYSFDLKDAINELSSKGFIEVLNSLNFYGNLQSDYTLSKQGKTLLESIESDVPQNFKDAVEETRKFYEKYKHKPLNEFINGVYDLINLRKNYEMGDIIIKPFPDNGDKGESSENNLDFYAF